MQQTTNRAEGSEGQGRPSEPRFLIIGSVVGSHGVRGEIKVQILTDDPHRFGLLNQVFIGLEDQEPVAVPLLGYRLHKGRALLRLENVDDRSTAETLKGYLIQVPREDAIPLEEGEFYEHQIIGLEVRTVAGERLGEVVEILYTGANEVYIVHSAVAGTRELLIPAIEDVIREIDLAGGRIIVELPEGLL
jgi:16S rRNA processing protein RimM